MAETRHAPGNHAYENGVLSMQDTEGAEHRFSVLTGDPIGGHRPGHPGG